jgi:serine/threonine-protein kinase
LQQSPNDHDALQDLGLVERRQGHWEQALAHLQRALVLDPLNAGLLTTVGGETLLNMRRFKEAHEALDRALAIAPNDGLALSYKVSAYQAEGKLEEAARILEQVPSDGIDPGLASYRAYQRLLERRFPVAIGEITPLLSKSDDALNGFGPLLTLYLGTAQRANGDAAAATATFERLIAQLQPKARRVDDSLAPVVLAQAYAEAGKHAAALDQARLALELFGNDANMRPTAQVAVAQVLMMGGDAEGAIEILKTTLPVAGAFYTAALLRLDPLWDPLRGNPRFEALLK